MSASVCTLLHCGMSLMHWKTSHASPTCSCVVCPIASIWTSLHDIASSCVCCAFAMAVSSICPRQIRSSSSSILIGMATRLPMSANKATAGQLTMYAYIVTYTYIWISPLTYIPKYIYIYIYIDICTCARRGELDGTHHKPSAVHSASAFSPSETHSTCTQDLIIQ